MFKKRELASLIAVFVIGVIFGILMFDFDTFYFRAFFTIALAFSVLASVVAKRSSHHIKIKPFIAVALAVAAFSFGVLRVCLYNDSVSENKIFDGKSDIARYEVSDVGNSWIDARVISSEIGVSNGSLIRIYIDKLPEGLISGDEFSAKVKYENIESLSQYSNGIDILGVGEIVEQYEVDGLFYNIRKSINDNCKYLYEDFDDAQAISKAVIIGDRTDLDSYIYSLYRNVGLSHVLAISGLHISIIAFGLMKFLTFLSVHKKIACAISAIFVLSYVALVGFSYGAVRSATMSVIMLVSIVFSKKSDSFTTLFIALALLLLSNPYSIFSKGLQLSFLCTLGILLSDPIMLKLKRWRFYKIKTAKNFKKILVNLTCCVLPTIIVSFSASVFSFPVLCFGFDTVSYISPLVNFITVFFFSLAIEFTFVAFLIAPFSSVIARLIAYPAGFVFDFVTDIAKYFYDCDIGITSVYSPYMIIPFVLSIVMILSFVFLSRHRLKVFFTAAVLFCISIFICVLLNNKIVSEKVIAEYNTTSSEYIYLQNKGENLYLDIGGYYSSSDAIYENGKTSLDQYVVLDYDSNSYSRFKRMIDNLKVYTVYLPNPKDTYQFSILSQFKELANAKNCDIITYNDEYTSAISDNATVSVFYPDVISKDNRLIMLDVNNKRLRFISDNNEHLVSADIAVLMDDFVGEYHNIISDKVVAAEKFIKNNNEHKDKLITYSKKVILEFIDKESAFLIYEP